LAGQFILSPQQGDDGAEAGIFFAAGFFKSKFPAFREKSNNMINFLTKKIDRYFFECKFSGKIVLP